MAISIWNEYGYISIGLLIFYYWEDTPVHWSYTQGNHSGKWYWLLGIKACCGAWRQIIVTWQWKMSPTTSHWQSKQTTDHDTVRIPATKLGARRANCAITIAEAEDLVASWDLGVLQCFVCSGREPKVFAAHSAAGTQHLPPFQNKNDGCVKRQFSTPIFGHGNISHTNSGNFISCFVY